MLKHSIYHDQYKLMTPQCALIFLYFDIKSLEASISTRKRWTVLIKYEIIYNLLEILPGVGDIFA
jgi:hypothetical protein